MTVKQLDILGRIGSVSSGIGVLVLLVKYGIGAGLIGLGIFCLGVVCAIASNKSINADTRSRDAKTFVFLGIALVLRS